MTVLTQCTECTNQAEAWVDDTRPLCDDCAHIEECPMPEEGEFTYGHAIASCNNCTYRSAYWECGCDLSHSCKEYK